MHLGSPRLRGAVPLLLLSSLVCIAAPSTAADLWQSQGSTVYASSGDELLPSIVSDGAGGFIAAWEDGRSSTSHDIYAQRMDAMGNPLWGPDGIPICTVNYMQSDVRVISDGAGGAIIAWQDLRIPAAGLYVQHVTSEGVPTWRVNGVMAAPITCLASYYTITTDGSGGVLLTWQKCTEFTGFDIGAQRVSATGVVRWGANGLPVCNMINNQTSPGIALLDDGTGDCVVAWTDNRSGIAADWNIYAQRISAAGSELWTNNGVPVAINVIASTEAPVQVCGDGADGAIVTWQDLGIGTYKVWTQRLNALGLGQWQANGRRMALSLGPQNYPVTISDGAGGILCAWYDQRNELSGDIYAQRVSNAGALLWDTLGVAVSIAPGQQFLPSIFRDVQGGMVIAWQDTRAELTADIYAQRLLVSNGAAQWTANGAALSVESNEQVGPSAATDGQGGLFCAWQDYRSGSSYDIYAIHAPSTAVGVSDVVRANERLRAVPSVVDRRTGAAPSFTARGVAAGDAEIRILDASGRSVRSERFGVSAAGDVQWRWDGRTSAGDDAPAGLYTVSLSAGRSEQHTSVIVLR